MKGGPMANRMDVQDFFSFEELLIEEDIQGAFGAVGCSKEKGPVLSGVYSMSENSYLFLVSGNIFKYKADK
jgi:hypothetical protein